MRVPSVGILEQPSAAPVAFPQTWAAPAGVQSSWSSVSNFYFNPNYAVGDSVDSFIDIPDTQSVAASGTYIIPPGWGICSLTSGATTGASLQVQQASSSGSTATGNWVPLATGTAGAAMGTFFMSDGVNFRINNPGTTAATAVFYRFR